MDRDPSLALFSTNLDLAAEQIIARFILCWNVEVTVEEIRRHLGVETQRQWSDWAITRTTPALFALFSLACWMAHRLVAFGTPCRSRRRPGAARPKRRSRACWR
jgi:hypothetical protein